MKAKPALQYHKTEQKLSPEEVVNFLEGFREMILGKDTQTKLISLRVPENVLEAFKAKASQQDTKYQTMIVKLMREWLK